MVTSSTSTPAGAGVQPSWAEVIDRYGSAWNLSAEAGAFMAVRESTEPGVRRVELHVGLSPAELAAKLDAAGEMAP